MLTTTWIESKYETKIYNNHDNFYNYHVSIPTYNFNSMVGLNLNAACSKQPNGVNF